MRRGVFCTFLLAGAILGSSRSAAAAFNPQYDGRATCGNTSSEVKLTKSTSGGKTIWTATSIPAEAFTSSITKEAKFNPKAPTNTSLVLRLKNDRKTSFTFIGEPVYEYCANRASASPDGLGNQCIDDAVTAHGSITITSSGSPYALFGVMFSQQSTGKYSKQPADYERNFNQAMPNYSTTCSLKIEIDSYKQLMKAVGQDVGDGQTAQEDTSTLSGLSTDGGGLVNTELANQESVCGKPKVSSIMRFAFCMLLDWVIEALASFI